METKVGKFSFKVPEDAPETVLQAEKVKVGDKLEKTFDYQVCQTDNEAQEIIAQKKGWSLIELVNDALKANARSSAYQTAYARFKPSEVSADDMKDRLIRTYVRLGIPEEMAKNQVEALLAANAEAPVSA